jgi:hypothetical protein
VKRPSTGAGAVPLRAEIAVKNGMRFVALSGSIDENADLQGLFAQLDGDAIMNLRDIERVNSMGVHRWIPLVTAFAAHHRLVFEELSYALVQNANVVANLFGTAHVRSCMAPYFCAHCKDNCSVAVTGEEVVASRYGPPVKRCAQCGLVMEFDELDGYFTFFKQRSRA